MQWSAKTSRGMVRPENEDSWSVRPLEDGWWIAMVADGVGGYEGGQVASSLAVKVCADYVAQRHGRESPEDLLAGAIQYCNRKILEAADGQHGAPGMGTTLTVALMGEQEGKLYVGHVGDSRAYVISSQEIKRITDDHSITGELIRNGTITEDDAMRHPGRNVITMALGLQEPVEVSLYREDLVPGDVVVLCTDGLTSLVSSKEIVKQVRESQRQEVSGGLVDAANARGGYDNVTVVLLWPDIPGSPRRDKRW